MLSPKDACTHDHIDRQSTLRSRGKPWLDTSPLQAGTEVCESQRIHDGCEHLLETNELLASPSTGDSDTDGAIRWIFQCTWKERRRCKGDGV